MNSKKVIHNPKNFKKEKKKSCNAFRSNGPVFVHMFLEVLVEVFEDHEKFRVGMDNVQEGNDVGVVKFFEERDLSDGCARNALVVSLKPNLFQSHCLENKLIQDKYYV